jgi:uncharacterized HAD superfamily protein
MKKIVIFSFILSLLITGCGKDDVVTKVITDPVTEVDTIISVKVDTAGTLSKLIPKAGKYLITDLTISGNLNGDDILYIREMAGGGYTANSKTEGKLARLDLTDVNIVFSTRHYFSETDSKGTITFYPTGSNFINTEMFSYLSSLTSITLPKSIIHVNSEGFNKCLNLKEINISKENALYTSINGVLFSKDSTELVVYPYAKGTSYTIPDYVKKIKEYAFSHCDKLDSIAFPGNHIKIESCTFHDCAGLTSVYFGNDIGFIWDAFRNCKSVKNIYCKSTTPIEVSSFIFNDTYKDKCTVHVPKGAAATYRNADTWKTFTNIVEE